MHTYTHTNHTQSAWDEQNYSNTITYVDEMRWLVAMQPIIINMHIAKQKQTCAILLDLYFGININSIACTMHGSWRKTLLNACYFIHQWRYISVNLSCIVSVDNFSNRTHEHCETKRSTPIAPGTCDALAQSAIILF